GVVTPASGLRGRWRGGRRRFIPLGGGGEMAGQSDARGPGQRGNDHVGLAGDWRSGWAERGRRIAAAPPAPGPAAPLPGVLAAALLGVLAAAEALWRALSMHASAPSSGISSGDWQLAVVVLVLLSLATTLPLGLLWPQPAAAAVAISAASLLSLGLFQMLTVA